MDEFLEEKFIDEIKTEKRISNVDSKEFVRFIHKTVLKRRILW